MPEISACSNLYAIKENNISYTKAVQVNMVTFYTSGNYTYQIVMANLETRPFIPT